MKDPEAVAESSPAPAWLRLQNALASAVLIALACAFYRLLPVHAPQFERRFGAAGFSFTGEQFLLAAALSYAAAAALWFFLDRTPAASKSLRALRVLGRAARSPLAVWRTRLDDPDRVAVLATALKMFFAPLMVMSLMMFCNAAAHNGWVLLQSQAWQQGFRAAFDRWGFWFLMQVIIFVDVLIYTVGYLVESRRRGSTIRSVDPTWLGWAAALMCYPPFNAVTGMLLGSAVSDFPKFEDPTAHIVLNGVMLLLMAVYAWASVAMGWKASNLTYRGMVTRGPYAVVRHPAYVCKNLAWWIGSLPVVSAAFATSVLAGLAALGSVAGWTALYVLRALTEEDHLRRVTPEYDAYAARVRWRFIPGVA